MCFVHFWKVDLAKDDNNEITNHSSIIVCRQHTPEQAGSSRYGCIVYNIITPFIVTLGRITDVEENVTFENNVL